MGAPVFGQRVQDGVRGGVVGLAGVAHRRGGGGEEGEHRQVEVPGQFVQEECRGDLRVEHRLEAFRSQAVQHAVVQHARRVDDAGQRRFLRYGGEDGGQRLPVGGVAGRDRGLGAQGGEFVAQFPCAGGVGAAAAEQHQAAGAGGGQPTGDLCAQGAGAAGDQHGAGRVPGAYRLSARYGHQAAAEDGRGPHRHLVLAVGIGEGGGEPGAGALVHGLGQVDQAAPALRVLQRGDPAQAPDAGLSQSRYGLGARHRDCGTGDAPQGCRDSGVAEGLHQCGGEGQTGGHAVRVGRRVEGEEGDHAGEPAAAVGVFAQPLGEGLALGVGHVDAHGVGAQEGDDVLHPGLVGVDRGDHGEPGAGQGGGACPAQRLPGDQLAPSVHGGLVAAPAAPVVQGREHLGQGVAVDVQGGGQGVEFLALDRGPERGVLVARDGCRGGLRLGPEPLALERVGGQVDPARPGPGEEAGPARAHAVDVQAGHGRDDRGFLTAVLAQCRYGHRLREGAVEGLLGHRAQDAVGADLHESRHAALGEGAYAVAEAHGPADVVDPVGGVAHLLRGGHCAGQVRHERQGRRSVRHATSDLPEVLKHGVHMR